MSNRRLTILILLLLLVVAAWAGTLAVMNSLKAAPLKPRQAAETPTTMPVGIDTPVAEETVATSDPLPDEQPAGLVASEPPLTMLQVVAVGDVMLGRKVNLGSLQRGDFLWPFRGAVDILRSADLTIGNLEGQIIGGCEPTDGRMIFCADPQAVEGLVWAGFDALSLANNHRLDFFEVDGFGQTRSFLEEAGIAPAYDYRLAYFDLNGVVVGVMGLDDILAPIELTEISTVIHDVRTRVDVLIGILHWGVEYTHEPQERQVELGRAMVDAGMQVVVGAHPHAIQPVEEYNGGLIAYSLGNFVFDQMQTDQTRRGDILVLTLSLDGKTLVSIDYRLVPVTIVDNGQPHIGGIDRMALLLPSQ